jgi:hypothetical protein
VFGLNGGDVSTVFFDGFASGFESKTTGVFPPGLRARSDFRTVNFAIFDEVMVGTGLEQIIVDVLVQMVKITRFGR